MDKAIITVLLIVCGLAATLSIFNGIYPALNQSQSAITGAAASASERIGSRIQIIQAGTSGNQITMWVKNVGTVNIVDPDRSDVFLTSGDTMTLIAHFPSPAPSWQFSLTGNDTEWVPASTIQVTISLAAPLSSGTYTLRMVTANGISDETTFSEN